MSQVKKWPPRSHRMTTSESLDEETRGKAKF